MDALKSVAERLDLLESEVAGIADDRGGCDQLWDAIADIRSKLDDLESWIGDVQSEVEDR